MINDRIMNNGGLASESTPLYLSESALTVFLRLRDVEHLVHVGKPLLPGHCGEQQAGDEEVAAAQRGEDVAFKFLHVWRRSSE